MGQLVAGGEISQMDVTLSIFGVRSSNWAQFEARPQGYRSLVLVCQTAGVFYLENGVDCNSV